MSLKRLTLCVACLLLCLGWAVTAHAQKSYSLIGGGGQIQIGGGLPLPIQAVNTTGGTPMNLTATGTNFPPLLIPPAPGVTIMGTTAMTTGQKITIPAGALSKPAVQLTLGQFDNNPNLYAVATNLQYTWPNVAATLSAGGRTGAATTTFVTGLGNNIRYSPAGLANKFGGPAQFMLSAGPPAGLMTAVPVTIYAIAVKGPGNPPCVHTALTPVPFPGPGNPACVAGIGQAFPTNGLAAHGGAAGFFTSTPGGTPMALLTSMTGTPPTNTRKGPKPGVGIGAFGTGPLNPAGPKGTVSFYTATPGLRRGFTNMASSFGYPFTTGKISLSAPLAAGAPETFKITGMDNRNAGGAGVIQLVAGALSQRTVTGPNANRAWVRLILSPIPKVPTMSPAALVATAGLMLLAVGYAMSKRLFA
jgi:hypothetical protein